jgi:uncharacterized membrane protein
MLAAWVAPQAGIESHARVYARRDVPAAAATEEESMMSTIREAVEVQVPVRTAYNQWTQFEEFPRFMEGVKRVVQLDDATLEWTAEVGGQSKTWTARIIEQEPDQRVSWEAIDGARNAGSVRFRPSELGTLVTLELDVEPDGPIEAAGDALGFIQRRARGDLERFRQFIESRRTETGAWRGEVARGDVVHDDQGVPSARSGGMPDGRAVGSRPMR